MICLHVNIIDQVCEVILLLLTRNHIPEFNFIPINGNNGPLLMGHKNFRNWYDGRKLTNSGNVLKLNFAVWYYVWISTLISNFFEDHFSFYLIILNRTGQLSMKKSCTRSDFTACRPVVNRTHAILKLNLPYSGFSVSVVWYEHFLSKLTVRYRLWAI